jgi:uncharacterized membrane protein
MSSSSTVEAGRETDSGLPSQTRSLPTPPSSVPPREGASRLAFLDWTRGLAAVIMLQGHVFHSFTRGDLRNQDAFILSQFVGGLPPAVFLFLTGVTLAFLMESRERQDAPGAARVWASLRRAGYLFALAFAFRVQLWLFAYPYSEWTALFRVDILNCMGLAIAVLSPMALFTTMERIRLCAILGLAIAGASPLVSALDVSAVHPFLRSYFVPSAEFFSFFPWAAFLAFGMSAGSILRAIPKPDLDKAVQWAAWMGLALIVAGQYFANIPYSLYTKSEFWLNSPALIFIKLGVILLITGFAFLWNRYQTGWSWVRQLGTTSLLVYWVHTELVYGRWLGALKESLNTPQTVALAGVVIGLMVGVSTARTRWAEIRAWFERWRDQSAPLPEAD